MFALLVKTYVIGLAVAMPVGAMGCLCVERTLAHGWRRGIATGAGIATADGIYAAVAAFGVTAVTSLLVSSQIAMRLAGGAALVFIGLRNALSASQSQACASSGQGSLVGLYAGAVALTLANPLTIISFGGILMGAGLVTASAQDAALAVLGVSLGSMSWWMVLVTAVAGMRHGLSSNAVAIMGRASGVVVASFGVLAVLSVFL